MMNNMIKAIENPGNLWLKASVVSGIWASFEIIVGSFMHNLRLPFTGTLLTFFSVSLLIAFSQLWHERGLLVRAGILCALMKSISPSAVILGPMTAIFMEGLLVELSLIVFGRNFIGYILAGVLGLLSALLHKVITLSVTYGFDLLKLYYELFVFASKQINLAVASPQLLITIFVFVYIIIGIVAAWAGYSVGKRAKLSQESMLAQAIKYSDNSSKPLFATTERSYSRLLLAFHIVSIFVFLVGVNFFPPTVLVVIFITYISFCLVYYKGTYRKLTKSLFIFQLVFILLVAVLLQKNNNGHTLLGEAGFISGLTICARAVFVIIAFSSLSIELRNPLIKDFLMSRGFRNLYLSLTIAFGILPSMIDRIASPAAFFKAPLATLSQTIVNAEAWYQWLTVKGEK